jgi:hypothetical protein
MDPDLTAHPSIAVPTQDLLLSLLTPRARATQSSSPAQNPVTGNCRTVPATDTMTHEDSVQHLVLTRIAPALWSPHTETDPVGPSRPRQHMPPGNGTAHSAGCCVHDDKQTQFDRNLSINLCSALANMNTCVLPSVPAPCHIGNIPAWIYLCLAGNQGPTIGVLVEAAWCLATMPSACAPCLLLRGSLPCGTLLCCPYHYKCA